MNPTTPCVKTQRSASWANTNTPWDPYLFHCTSQEGGALYANDGFVTFESRSFIRNCVAPVGAALQIVASSVSYVFPTLAGYWLPQTECLVYREACP
eukprot:2314786-Pleurochrysis_carterae.AAC.1